MTRPKPGPVGEVWRDGRWVVSEQPQPTAPPLVDLATRVVALEEDMQELHEHLPVAFGRIHSLEHIGMPATEYAALVVRLQDLEAKVAALTERVAGTRYE